MKADKLPYLIRHKVHPRTVCIILNKRGQASRLGGVSYRGDRNIMSEKTDMPSMERPFSAAPKNNDAGDIAKRSAES
jgi:hypothetical protein